jgi:hypothetical protein
MIVLLAASAPPAAASEGCPNEARRAEQGEAGLALPDCRAYELVTPGIAPFRQISALPSISGNGITYYARYPAEDAQRSDMYDLSTRGAAGWSVQDVTPQIDASTYTSGQCQQYPFFSPDLSKSVLTGGLSAGCEPNEEELVPGEPRGPLNLYLRDTATGAYQLVNVTPQGVVPNSARFEAASADFSHIIFSEGSRLTPEAPPGGGLYDWTGGVLRFLTILPGGTPVSGSLDQGVEFGAAWTHPVSADGKQVIFSYGGSLYLRENPEQPAQEECATPAKACTIPLDPSGGASFQRASADGSKVFFLDPSALTADAEAGTPNLYEYDVASGHLTDLTPSGAEPTPSVQNVVGISEDGSSVYFLAAGVLTGTERNSQGAQAQAGEPNLYLRHAGATAFIATLSESDTYLHPYYFASVSANGKFVAFASVNSLTGYDNLYPGAGECPNPFTNHNSHCSEVFEYGAESGQLSCASCNPSGAPPGQAVYVQPDGYYAYTGSSETWQVHDVSDSGGVFFTTGDALLPQDTNGVRDVYEYENGQEHLISTGSSLDASYFINATPSGNDVFFQTSQSLVRADGAQGTLSLYDARVGGGFPEPPPLPPCEGEEACHGGPVGPPAVSSPGTAHFEGPGNQAEKPLVCKKGLKKTTVHGRAVCRKVKKHHRRKRLAGYENRAGLNRGGAR